MTKKQGHQYCWHQEACTKIFHSTLTNCVNYQPKGTSNKCI